MLILKDIQFSYSKRIGKVLSFYDQINIEKGINFIIGDNGCGKTTLFKLILGLRKLDSGTIKYSGKNPPRYGFSLDKPNAYDSLNARENLKYFSNYIDEFDFDKELKLLELFNLNEKVKFKNYSLGMAKKYNIICGLINDPNIWILDEPFNGLDEKSCKTLEELINEKSQKAIIIISTHDRKMRNKFKAKTFTLSEGVLE